MKTMNPSVIPGANQRGIALILVLLVIAALSVLILNLNYTTRVNLHLANNFRDETRASFLARGAVDAAIYWLEQDESNYDALCESGDPQCENEWSLDNPGMDIGDGFVQIKIRPEDGKIWINDTKNLFKPNPGLQPSPLLDRLRNELDLKDEVLDSIQDWIDADDNVFRAGAEEDYYASLESPYEIRNGPLLDVSELLLVKEVDDWMFLGGNEEHPIGLKEVFTVFSSGKINVNAAPATVISALGDNIDGLTVVQDRLSTPFKTTEEFASYISTIGGTLRVPQDMWDIASKYFSVYIKVQVHKVNKFVHAVLKRDANNVTMLAWREEDPGSQGKLWQE